MTTSQTRPMDELTLPQLQEAVTEKTNRLAELWRQAGPDYDMHKIDGLSGTTDDRLDELNKLGKELDDFKQQLDRRRGIEQAANKERMRVEHFKSDLDHPVGGPPTNADNRRMSLGEMFVRSDEYAAFSHLNLRTWPRPVTLKDFDVRNAVFHTGDGFTPPEIRIGRVEPSAQAPVTMIDVVPTVPTSQDTIRFMLETTYDASNVVEKAETTATAAADIAGEADIAYTEQTQPVEWLPAYLPTTIQQLEDVDGIQELLNRRLGRMVRARASRQILRGNGTTPNLRGTNSLTGILTTGKGADTTPDAVYKAVSAIRTGSHYEPDTVVMHPDDWVDIATLKTTDGLYIWGNPANAQPMTFWGLRVVVTSEQPENTAIVGDYAGASDLYVRRGLTLQVSDSHAFMFTRGQVAVLASWRGAMVHYNAKAFSTVTGI